MVIRIAIAIVMQTRKKDTQFKQSIYNIYIENEENILLYNSHSGAICELDKSSFAYISNIDCLSSVEQENSEYFNELKENAFIIPQDFNESNFFRMEHYNQQFSNFSERITVVITPTMKCNFKCFYCFENDIDDKRIMNNDIVSDVIEFIRNIISENNQVKYLHISWFGGEPLLEIDLIKHISLDIKGLCEILDIKYTSSIVTNGLLLDQNYIGILKDCNVNSVQISLDGDREETCIRKGISSKQFDTIVENIQYACNKINLSIRINVDKLNYTQVKQITQYLLVDMQLDNKLKLYIAPIRSKGEQFYSSYEFSKVQIEFYKFLYDNKCFSNLERIYPKSKYISCGLIQKNNFVIDSSGNLYKCEHLVGKSELSVGSVKNGRNFSDAEFMFTDLEYLNKCTKCKYFPICRGGCAKERYYENEPLDCKAVAYEVKETIKLIYKLSSNY